MGFTGFKDIEQHGISMYRQRGCRCEICKEEASVQRAKYRPRKQPKQIKLDARDLQRRLAIDGRLDVLGRHTMRRWLENGINVYAADEVCMKLGYHPIEIWGQAFYAGCFDD